MTPRVAAAKGRVIAAVAYVGSGGPEVLPLKRGDGLICDASTAAVAAGSTSVAALRQYLQAGVEIYSHPGLHAKVVLLPRRLFIGSANASSNSRDVLDEAMLETTDPAGLAQAQAFMYELMQPYDQLGEAELADLSKIKVFKRPQGAPPLAPSTAVPPQVHRLWLGVAHFQNWTKSSDAVYAKERRRVGRQARRSGRVFIEAVEWIGDEASRFRPDDWLVQIINGRMYAPARVVKVSPSTNKYSLVWLAAPSTGPKSLRLSSLPPALQPLVKSRDLVELKGARTRAICTLFQGD